MNFEEHDGYQESSRLDSIVSRETFEQQPVQEIKSNSGGDYIESMSPLYQKSPIAET